MIKFFKRIFKKNHVSAVTLTLREIKELASYVGFIICKDPEGYQVNKDSYEHAMNVYEDYREGFAMENDDDDVELHRVVCNPTVDTDIECVQPLGRDMFEEEGE